MTKRPLEKWTAERSAELYGIRNWSGGYFDVAENGDLVLVPAPGNGVRVSVPQIIDEPEERGLELPVLLRVENILASQISLLHETFRTAIAALGYRANTAACSRSRSTTAAGVEEIAQFGSRYHHGQEVGSKAELIAALPTFRPRGLPGPQRLQGRDFVDLALYATKWASTASWSWKCPGGAAHPGALQGPGRAAQDGRAHQGQRPCGRALGRVRGDLSIFGLSTAEVVDVVASCAPRTARLPALLHFHLGSQIPNIRDIRTAEARGCRMYAELVGEGCAMAYLDLGGAWPWTTTARTPTSIAAQLYPGRILRDIEETVMSEMDERDMPHPHIVTNPAGHGGLLLRAAFRRARRKPPGEPPRARRRARGLPRARAQPLGDPPLPHGEKRPGVLQRRHLLPRRGAPDVPPGPLLPARAGHGRNHLLGHHAQHRGQAGRREEPAALDGDIACPLASIYIAT
jgi:arginine decarboxylase